MLQALLGVVIDHRQSKLTPSAASEATEENGNAVHANASTSATPSSLPVALPGVTSSSIAVPTSSERLQEVRPLCLSSFEIALTHQILGDR